jgi:Ca-activated chloride channel homolog
MRRVLPVFVLTLALVAALVAGRAGFGRLALAAGMPAVAAKLLDDPAARGVALYEAGDFAGADAAFEAAGRSQTFNRALSLAALGDYPLSLAYFDAVLFAEATDMEARRDRDLVARLVPPVIGEANAIDGIPATAAREEESAAASHSGPTLTMGEQAERVLRPRDDNKATVASTDWLDTLADEPGTYLKLRFQAESQQRFEDGLAVPPEDTPW